MNACQQDILTQVIKMLFLAMAVATVSVTMTKAKISEPVRNWIKGKSKFLGDLTSCPYCFSHWGSLIAVLIFNPKPVQTSYLAVNGFSIIDLFITVFSMVAMAAWFAFVILRTYGSQYHK